MSKGETMKGMDDKTTMLDKKGGQQELKVGSVIESKLQGALTPAVVYSISTDPGIGESGMTVYGIAGKDRRAVSRKYTIFQLECMGYRLTGSAKGFDASEVEEPKETVSLITMEPGPATGKAPESPCTAKKGPVKGESTPKGSKGLKSDPTAPQKPIQSIMSMLESFVYGIEPENMDELKDELISLGVDTKSLMADVQVAIERAYTKAIKSNPEGK